MRILIFSPKTPDSRAGNFTTASRWQKLLQSAGHRVQIGFDSTLTNFDDVDLLIGLHATRSAKMILRFRKRHPNRSAMIALTGTDLYRDLTRPRKPATAIKALDQCSRILILQPLMAKRLPKKWRRKSQLVMMDVAAKAKPNRTWVPNRANVCVIGHLRYEKDPFRAEMAVRSLPDEFSIRVSHAGASLIPADPKGIRIKQRQHRNENWKWLNSIPQSQVLKLMQRSDLLVNSSRIEGAPNVLFEAMAVGLPMLLSNIDGHVGVMGQGYPGYFPVGDTRKLRELLIQTAHDKSYRQKLANATKAQAKTYRAGREKAALAEITERRP